MATWRDESGRETWTDADERAWQRDHRRSRIASDTDEMELREDRRQAYAGALLARLRGVEPTGQAADYPGLKLPFLCFLSALDQHGVPRDQKLAAAGTGDLPYIFANVLQARIGDFFRVERGIARTLSRRFELEDFRQTSVIVPEAPRLQSVAEHGELRVGFLGEGGEPLLLVRRGSILELTYESVRNDDVGAVDALAIQFAQSALDVENELFAASLTFNSGAGPVLRDGIDLFHASHGNLLTGGALSASTLGAAFAALRKQTSISGTALNLRPRYVLVEPDDELTARGLVRDLSVPGGETVEVVVDSRLDGFGFYVFADPRVLAAYSLGFLGRQDTPVIGSERNFTTDGFAFKGVHQVAVAPLNFRAVNRTPAS